MKELIEKNLILDWEMEILLEIYERFYLGHYKLFCLLINIYSFINIRFLYN